MPAADAKKPKTPKGANKLDDAKSVSKKVSTKKPKKGLEKTKSRWTGIRAEILMPLSEVGEELRDRGLYLQRDLAAVLDVHASLESCVRLASALDLRDNRHIDIVYGTSLPSSRQVDILRALLEKWNPKDTFATCDYAVRPDETVTMYLSYEDHGLGGIKICICPLADR